VLSFIPKKAISEISVSTGTAATIIEAFDAVVYLIPVFSNIKYNTIPRKPETEISAISLILGILNDLVTIIAIERGIKAISCLNIAMVEGGR